MTEDEERQCIIDLLKRNNALLEKQVALQKENNDLLKRVFSDKP